MNNTATIFAGFLRRSHVGQAKAIMARAIHADYAPAYPELVGSTLKATQDILYFAKRDYNRENGVKIGSGAKGYYWIAAQDELVQAHAETEREAMTRHGQAKRIKQAVEKYNQLEFEV